MANIPLQDTSSDLFHNITLHYTPNTPSFVRFNIYFTQPKNNAVNLLNHKLDLHHELFICWVPYLVQCQLFLVNSVNSHCWQRCYLRPLQCLNTLITCQLKGQVSPCLSCFVAVQDINEFYTWPCYHKFCFICGDKEAIWCLQTWRVGQCVLNWNLFCKYVLQDILK